MISEYDGHDALFIAERISVGGGHLHIDTVLEKNEFEGVTYNMTSGWIDSKQKVRGSAPNRRSGRAARACAYAPMLVLAALLSLMVVVAVQCCQLEPGPKHTLVTLHHRTHDAIQGKPIQGPL